MKAINCDSMPDIRLIIFGGEGYPKPELKKLYNDFSGRVELVNVYGPTECTCICSAHTITDDDFESMDGLPTLGHLNQNFDYQVLDEHDFDSDVGELCLIGPNVASGYFNDPERTADAFLTLYQGKRYLKRMYKTGDMVRVQDGQLYFLGRKDNQIKHMGYRIELEEIETALQTLKGVVQGAVVYKRENTAFGKIYSYVQAAPGFDISTAMQSLREKLPDYMLPSKIILMESLPLNANGKVDRKALAEQPVQQEVR